MKVYRGETMTPKILIADDNKANILALESVVSSLDVVLNQPHRGLEH